MPRIQRTNTMVVLKTVLEKALVGMPPTGKPGKGSRTGATSPRGG